MMRRTADWKEYALDERRRANMAEQKLLLVNAELTCAKNAVTGVVKSWDSLKPGQYDKDIWETWLVQKMKPAVDAARVGLAIPVENLPDEMVRLIIAARVVAFSDQSREAIKELDTASEAFAECAPWKDQSDSSEWDGMSRCRKCRTAHSPNVACAKKSAVKRG